MLGKFWTLAAVIAAHPNGEVEGRTRLQKSVYLLQRLGLPTDYLYSIYFYGTYSEDLHSEISLLENMHLVQEIAEPVYNGESTRYVIRAIGDVDASQVSDFQRAIDLMANTALVHLELAATYDAYRRYAKTNEEALESLRRKKPSKCNPANESAAFSLLGKLGLKTAPQAVMSSGHDIDRSGE
jgi:uncharacterized protein YwgA